DDVGQDHFIPPLCMTEPDAAYLAAKQECEYVYNTIRISFKEIFIEHDVIMLPGGKCGYGLASRVVCNVQLRQRADLQCLAMLLKDFINLRHLILREAH